MARTRPTTSVHTGQPAVKTSTLRFAVSIVHLLFFLQAFEDRAALGRLSGLAGAYQVLQHPGERFQVARRSEEHTSELQSLAYLVCRLLLEKKKINSVSTTR